MATTDSQDNRDHPYYHVRDLFAELLSHPKQYLSSDDLAKAGIEVVTMDIATGVPADSGPQFCDLCPQKEFDAMFNMVEKWPRRKGPEVYFAAIQMGQLIYETFHNGGLASQSKYVWRSLRNNTPFEAHNDVGSRTDPPCYAKGVFDTLNPSIPHLGTLLTDGVDSDNRLRWSEVCWAACLMAGRLRDKEYRKHEIVPVFVYSIAGRNARVIQAYYENGKFIIRKTEHISFENENIDGLKLFLRWIMNIPKVETN